MRFYILVFILDVELLLCHITIIEACRIS